MVGPFSTLERTSLEPIVLQVQGGNMRAMPRCLSEVVWDEAQMRQTEQTLVHDDMGDPAGVLIFDETGLPKKGKDSVGVTPQYGPGLGPVANCQVGVFAAYASRHGYALVDTRLFVPEPWLTEAYPYSVTLFSPLSHAVFGATARQRDCAVAPRPQARGSPQSYTCAGVTPLPAPSATATP